MPNVLSVLGKVLEQPHRGLGKKPTEAIHIVLTETKPWNLHVFKTFYVMGIYLYDQNGTNRYL